MDAVQLRCRELAEASLAAIDRQLLKARGDQLGAPFREIVQARIETLLREIATGQTILKPNRRQRAEVGKGEQQ